jgi:molecular chaperone HtpG
MIFLARKEGSLTINSENIFPIIKKWLYSDHDIFFRELVSNGVDAVTKLRALASMGEYELPDGYEERVDVVVDPESKTIRFIDTGLGMTADEVDRFINQIAFSGAAAFMEAYKDKTSEEQIIGHFGLGFYSAFMVADRVTIDSLSYAEGAVPVRWESQAGTEFTMEEGTRTEVGTEVVLYINEESEEFLQEFRAREVIDKYCSFMSVPIYLHNKEQWESWLAEKDVVDVDSQEEAETKEASEASDEAGEGDGSGKPEDEGRPEGEGKSDIPADRMPVNDTHPLWMKRPSECTDEEYKEFFRKVFKDYIDPLFWIHLNMDYPFNLKGILYFPKINTEYDTIEGKIKLYNNRVFIADNIKEVIPEYLMLLKGVIDCPDLPLNVSRSALQNDGFVKRISDYITKKVADRLNEMRRDERENYEKFWDDISPFIKFGCLKDSKFYEKMKESLLFKNLDGEYVNLEYLNGIEGKTVVYVTDEVRQSQYIKMYKDAGMNAVILKTNIDTPFIQMLEQTNQGLKFVRIDAGIQGALKSDGTSEDAASKEDTEALTKAFREALGKDKLTVKVELLKDSKLSAVITEDESSRRLHDMIRMYSGQGMGGMAGFEPEESLTLNFNNPLVRFILENKDSEHVPVICRQLYDLARISRGPLEPEQMSEFIARSNEILELITK